MTVVSLRGSTIFNYRWLKHPLVNLSKFFGLNKRFIDEKMYPTNIIKKLDFFVFLSKYLGIS